MVAFTFGKITVRGTFSLWNTKLRVVRIGSTSLRRYSVATNLNVFIAYNKPPATVSSSAAACSRAVRNLDIA